MCTVEHNRGFNKLGEKRAEVGTDCSAVSCEFPTAKIVSKSILDFRFSYRMCREI